jgi:hypothetical protein
VTPVAKASQELIAPPAEGKKTSYERWLESEGVPVVKAFFIEDIRTVSVDRREGGDQIEYRDEEPIVRQMFEEGLTRQGIKSEMKKHYPNKL